MIDLEKECEEFAKYNERYPSSNKDADHFTVWLKRAELAQEEIIKISAEKIHAVQVTDACIEEIAVLKQKLEKLESGEGVKSKKSEINDLKSMNHHLNEINSDLDRSISIMRKEITELRQKLERYENDELYFKELKEYQESVLDKS